MGARFVAQSQAEIFAEIDIQRNIPPRGIVKYQPVGLSSLTLFSVPALSFFSALALYPGTALAYVGPPAALGVLGIVLSISTTVFGLLVHGAIKTTRRLFRRVSTDQSTAQPAE
jgi:hypothetical protein